MKLSFNVFGFEVATVKLDLPTPEKHSPVEEVVESLVDKTIGSTTKFWLGRLFK